MNKNETIIEIMNVYDENERLKHEIEVMKRYQNVPFEVGTSEPNNGLFVTIDKEMIKVGKKKILENVLYSWNMAKVTYDEEKDIYKVTSYDEWLKGKMRKDKLPSYMSLDQFKVYFYDDLIKLYEKEKTEALNTAKGIENVEDE